MLVSLKVFFMKVEELDVASGTNNLAFKLSPGSWTPAAYTELSMA